ncbi:RNA polymerase I-specific transcription initiation factor RRN3 [Aplysia californica]|uniref:RNA polymerase I-specific transcription initiation factor RRN3 n=1 Tax=Aplysia californica TaxID=6500 RepID=A0ABM1VP12_APLCA|nr:RNA polymerase I-specific transcription initiation factor RRN3 [Aplysia californica]
MMAQSVANGGLSYSDMASVLRSAKQGDGNEISGNSYDCLLRLLADPESEISTVKQCLQDLEQCVSYLGQGHPTLVRILMNLNWLDRGPELTAVYQSFILNLVSAHINLLKPCLRNLIKKFIPNQKNAEVDEMKLKVQHDFGHVHALLKSLSHLVPMTSVVMMSVLEELFPYINKGSFQFEHYSRNVLSVCTYMPALRMELLELVVKNMLKLDVRSSRTDINSAIGITADSMDDVKDEEEEDALFDMEDVKSDMKDDLKPDVKGEWDGDLKCEKEKEDPEYDEMKSEAVKERLAAALPLATSLDAVMSLTLQFVKESCHPQGQLDWAVTKKLYRELLSVFDKYIFPTHASCHVQFLLFFACSFNEALADGFIDYLWKKVINPSTQSVYRQTAACYIGSFVTRASYISISTCRGIMELMARWLHSYLDQSSDQQHKADLAHHGPFYSVCQSLFYCFCFMHNDIMQLKDGHKWAVSLNFQRIITSKLNPLRVCLPIVVKTFASATRMHQLAFCDTIIERNNRYTLPVAVSSFALGTCDQRQLESYFPFDPYLLPRSRMYITPLYREYSGSLPEEQESGDEDEDDFLPEEDDFGHHPISDHISMSLGKSPVDFLHYSTSPGFKHG